MKKTIALLVLFALLATVSLAEATGSGASGFPYQDLDIAPSMPTCYFYRYTNDTAAWNSAVITAGSPYLRLLLMGTGGGDIKISLTAVDSDTDAEAERLDFTIDGYTHTLSLTERAISKELHGFWVYKTNFALVEALAKGQDIALSATFSGVRREIPLDEDACKALRALCAILVEDDVLLYLNDTYSDTYLPVLDSYMDYSVREAASAPVSFPDEGLFTEFERSGILDILSSVYSAREMFSDSSLRADVTIRLMLDLVGATRISVEGSDYTFHWRDDSYAGLLNDQELIVAFLADAKPGKRNAALFVRYNVATGACSYRIVDLDVEKAPGFAAGYLAALCGQDNYAFNALADLNAAIDTINKVTGLSL